MNTPKFFIVSVAILAVGVAVWYFSPEKTTVPAMPTQIQTNSGAKPTMVSESASGGDKTVTYTLTEVQKHATKGDCWMIMDSVVYDMSSYKTHPGGEIIWNGCGKDATALFETRPDGSSHSDRARTKREEFKIGILSQ